MLSSTAKRLLKLRLALIKYSGCSAFHWDFREDRLVLAETYLFWIWTALYYAVYPITFSFIFALHHYNTYELNDPMPDEAPEAEADRSSYRTLQIIFLFLVVIFMVFVISIISILKECRHEICALLNAFFTLDAKLNDAFKEPGTGKLPQPLQKCYRKYEVIIYFTCWASTVVAPWFFLEIFVPADPIRMLLQEYLEITVKPGPGIFVIQVFYMWGIFALSNTLISFIIPVLLAMTFCTVWNKGMMPEGAEVAVNSGTVSTALLGELRQDRVVWLYRSHQTLCNYINGIMQHFRLAIHFAILHIGIVIIIFLIMRNYQVCIENDDYEVLILFSMLLLISITVIRVECIHVGTVVDSSNEVKQWIVRNTGRRSYLNKVGRSFQVMVIATAGNLFTVSRDTFLEFCNVCVDHLVNLLCM